MAEVDDKSPPTSAPFLWLHLHPEQGLVVESNIGDPKDQNALLDAAKALVVARIIQSVSPAAPALVTPSGMNGLARRILGR